MNESTLELAVKMSPVSECMARFKSTQPIDPRLYESVTLRYGDALEFYDETALVEMLDRAIGQAVTCRRKLGCPKIVPEYDENWLYPRIGSGHQMIGTAVSGGVTFALHRRLLDGRSAEAKKGFRYRYRLLWFFNVVAA